MKKLFVSLILCLLMVGCGGGGSAEAAKGGKPGKPGPTNPYIHPTIVGDGNVDFYYISINGIEKETFSPLEYYPEYLGEGVYKMQIRAVLNDEVDAPINFTLIIIEYPDGWNYEMVPDEGYEPWFAEDKLIYWVEKKKTGKKT